MHVLSENIGLLWEALFLQREPYAAMRNQKNPARKGLVLLLLLGLLLALAAFIGSIFTWASSPNPAEIQAAVLGNLQQMSWWAFIEAEPELEAMWFQIWDSIWQFMRFVTPSPSTSLAGFLTTPLSLLLSWFLFALVANPLAKLFGGTGHFSQTLGTTALAAAPQLLALFHVVPYVMLAGIAVWTLLARYMAIRVTHDLSWARAVWVTLLAMLIIWLIKILLVGAGAALFGAAAAAAFGGM